MIAIPNCFMRVESVKIVWALCSNRLFIGFSLKKVKSFNKSFDNVSISIWCVLQVWPKKFFLSFINQGHSFMRIIIRCGQSKAFNGGHSQIEMAYFPKKKWINIKPITMIYTLLIRPVVIDKQHNFPMDLLPNSKQFVCFSRVFFCLFVVVWFKWNYCRQAKRIEFAYFSRTI